MTQSEIANQLSYSTSTLQRYRNDKNMPSPYRIQSIISNKRSKSFSNTNFNNNSHREQDLKRPQLISKDLVKTDTNTKSNKKTKSILKLACTHDIFEINDPYLDEISDFNVI